MARTGAQAAAGKHPTSFRHEADPSARIPLGASPGDGQELSGTFARCLKLEQEIHHAASKLCILGFETLE
jgi:hypothetical protein